MEKDERNSIEEQDSIELLDIINTMWKRLLAVWWIILLIVSMLSSAAYFYAKKVYQPQYTAYSTFTVNANTVYGYSKDVYNQAVATQLGKVFPYLLTNNVLKELVAKDLGTETVPGRVTASTLENTNLITLTVVAENGELAYQILHSVINNYPTVSKYVIGDVTLNLLDESGVPAVPTNSFNPKKSAVYGAAGGGLLGIMLLFMLSLTKNTITSEEELRRLFNISCVGTIPRTRIKNRSYMSSRSQMILIGAKGVPQYFYESIRTIRNRVENICRSKGINCLLITSAIPGEGKTTIAANLALALANKGKKVMLIDGDLRNPSIGDLLRIKTDTGLFEYLSEKAELKECVNPYEGNNNLSVIPGGMIIANPSEYLHSSRFRSLIADAREKYDYVIVDTPPSAVVSDASNIARIVDGGLFVVRQDYCRTDMIQEGMEMHVGTGIQMLGTVLNNTMSGITGGYSYGNYGYGRYGNYGYGYGYSYGSEEEAEQ